MLQFEDIELHQQDIYVLQHELEEIVPQHTHTQGHILVVLNGVATMDVEHSTYYIPNGYFVWIPPKVSHRIAFVGKKVQLLNIYYPQSFAKEEFYQEVGLYPIPSLLYHTFELVKEQTESYPPKEWHYELLATINRTLPHIIEKQIFDLRLPTTSNPVALKIIEAIQTNYRSQLTEQAIASQVGLSVRSLSRYLRNELDTSFVQYLRTFRIIMAIKQMVKGDESITNIAYNVGYESLTAFSNCFYKVTGHRPSTFMK